MSHGDWSCKYTKQNMGAACGHDYHYRKFDQPGGTSWTQIKDRFLIGAGGSYALGSTGGSATHTMSAAEMPAHSHSGSITAVGNHNHTIHDAGGTSIYNILEYLGNEKIYTTVTVSFGTAGAHTHSVSIGSNGSGKAFDIMNPYVAKYMWRRVS